MNKFEAVLLINPDISKQILKKEIENFKKQISSNNGEIINIEDWGLRDLSYKISTFKNWQAAQILEILMNKIDLYSLFSSLNDISLSFS